MCRLAVTSGGNPAESMCERFISIGEVGRCGLSGGTIFVNGSRTRLYNEASPPPPPHPDFRFWIERTAFKGAHLLLPSNPNVDC